ncbi:conserved hypothetical protein [Carnobacterium maltaromaticum]|nr:conserved hypothetical protein [Carnobacterium maltaromaticum]
MYPIFKRFFLFGLFLLSIKFSVSSVILVTKKITNIIFFELINLCIEALIKFEQEAIY